MKFFFLLILFISRLSIVDDQKYGDWLVMQSNEFSIAKTVNDSGSVVGMICSPNGNNRSPYLPLDISCEDKSVNPMMMNSKTGSLPVAATCSKIGEALFLIFNDYQSIQYAFESGGEIGFAIPMADGKFKVVRFSTTGAIPATKQILLSKKNIKQTGLKDESF